MLNFHNLSSSFSLFKSKACMENNKNPKNQDDYSDRNSHQSVDNSLVNQSRSYLCSFCIRGFSNAQALGGHMNIHRRDRAQLRQKLMEDNMDDDVVVESNPSEVVSLDLNEQQQEEEEEEEEPLACDDDQDMEKNLNPGQKLGFWVQESKLDTNNDHGKVTDHVSIDGLSSSNLLEIEGLDLELRLGQSAVEKRKT